MSSSWSARRSWCPPWKPRQRIYHYSLPLEDARAQAACRQLFGSSALGIMPVPYRGKGWNRSWKGSGAWHAIATVTDCGFLLGLEHPSRIDRLLLCNTPEPWARLNPRVAIGLRRAWYVPLGQPPSWGVDGEASRICSMVSAAGWPGCSPTRMRRSTPTNSAILPAPPRHHGCTGTTFSWWRKGSCRAAPCRPAAQRSNPRSVRRRRLLHSSGTAGGGRGSRR